MKKFDFDLFKIQEKLSGDFDLMETEDSNGNKGIIVNFTNSKKCKICTFDCIYCQYGKTKIKTLDLDEYFDSSNLLKKIDKFKNNISFAFISGFGEHLLDIKFHEVIDKIREKTENIVVLTHGVLINQKEVKESLMQSSIIIPTLVSVNKETFIKICRPPKELNFGKYLDNLKEFKKEYRGKIYLEIFFVKGFNDSENELRKMYYYLKELKPHRIYLNTVLRAPALDCKGLELEELEKIKNRFKDICEINIPEFNHWD